MCETQYDAVIWLGGLIILVMLGVAAGVTLTQNWAAARQPGRAGTDAGLSVAISLAGLVLVVTISAVAAWSYWSEHDPAERAAAQASLAAALAQPVPPGHGLTEFAGAFLQEQRAWRGVEIREVIFVPARREPTDRARQEQTWRGRLCWEERPRSSTTWEQHSCRTWAVWTANEGWGLKGTRTC